MNPSTRGSGRIFRRGAIWWCAFYRAGTEVRQSTSVRVDSSSPQKAERAEKRALAFLKARTGQVEAERQGGPRFITPRAQRVTVGELLSALETSYKLDEIYNPRVASHMKPVLEYFGHMRAVDVTAEDVDAYIAGRRAAGRSNTTINRETQPLGAAFRLGVERGHLSVAPKIRRFSEKGNARQGWFSDHELRALVDGLPAYLRDFVLFAYHASWRKSEIASLRWEDVDGDVIRLKAEHSKNGEARSLALDGELADVIARRQAARQVKTDAGVTLSALVFHRNGQPIGDFRKAWATACKMAGVQGKLFHDLRRSSIRNMIRAGVSEKVAMGISGHRTRSVFDRYNITSERDQREAVQRTQDYLIAARAQEAKQQPVEISRVQ